MINNVKRKVITKICFNLADTKTRYLYGVVRRGLAANLDGGSNERN